MTTVGSRFDGSKYLLVCLHIITVCILVVPFFQRIYIYIHTLLFDAHKNSKRKKNGLCLCVYVPTLFEKKSFFILFVFTSSNRLSASNCQ